MKPFSVTPYYDFVDAFMLGLKLETFFVGADACTTTIISGIDDYFYFRNNLTDFSWSSWEAPVMNITKAIAI